MRSGAPVRHVASISSGGDEARLLRIHEAVVAAVQALVPDLGRRLVEPPEIGLPHRSRVGGRLRAGLQVVRDQVVQPGDHRGAALRDDALGVGRLARLQQRHVHHGRGVKILRQRAPDLLGATARVGEHLRDRAAAGQARDEPVAQLAGQGLRLRAEGRDVDRDRVVEIDEAMLAHLEPDRVGLAVQRVVDLFAAEQGADGLHVRLERSEAHRLLAERAHRGVAGAEPDEAAAGREAVDGGDAVRRHRREPEPGHVHPGAEAHAPRLLGGQGQHRPAVRPDHLAVGDPAVRVAEVLGVGDVADLVDLGVDDAEVHGYLSSHTSCMRP